MSKIQQNYSDNCYYCKSKFQSEICLLPLGIINKLPQGELNLDEVLIVDDIHNKYGQSILSHNKIMQKMMNSETGKEKLEWQLNFNALALETKVINSSFDDEIKSKSNISYKDSSTQMSEQDITSNEITKKTKPTLKTNISQKEHDSSKDEKLPMKNKHKAEGSKQSWSDIVSEELDEREKRKELSKSLNLQDNKVSKSQPIRIENESHFINDLVLLIKTAYNIHSNKRSQIKVGKLFYSLNYETNLAITKGKNYNPVVKGELNGEIALSKSIAASHSTDELEIWMSGDINENEFSCILNSEQLQANEILEGEQTLLTTCIKCFNSMIFKRDIQRDQKNKVMESLKFILEMDGLKESYSWIINETRELNKPTKSSERKEKMIDVSKIEQRYKQSNKYPNMDMDLIDYINENLDKIVKKVMENEKLEITNQKYQGNAQEYFRVLISEFLNRNKTWNDDKSFTTPNHLAKLLESTGLEIKSNEILNTFKIMREVLHEFRKSFKERKITARLDNK